MTECDIQVVLGDHYGVQRKRIAVPNVLLGHYEADFITITKCDFLIEVEIKISISDFRADFKKKHYHDCPEVKKLYYALPKELYEKHNSEIDESCDRTGAGIILIETRILPNGNTYYDIDRFAKEPKPRRVKPLTVYQKLNFAMSGCLRWPSFWHYRNR